MSEAQSLPPYKFSRNTDLTPPQIDEFTTAMRDEHYFRQDEHVENMEGWKNLLERLAVVQGQWFAEVLGLDVTERLTIAASKAKFFDSDEGIQRVTGEDRRHYTSAHVSESNEVLVKVEGTTDYVMHSMAHELMHAAQAVTFEVKRDRELSGPMEEIAVSVKTLLKGYHYANESFDSLGGFHEAITELMTIEFEEWFQNRPQTKYTIEERYVAYSPHVILVDMLSELIAEKTGSSSQEIRQGLYRGEVIGDFRALRIIEQTLGRGTLRILQGMLVAQSDEVAAEAKKSAHAHTSEELRKERRRISEQTVIAVAEQLAESCGFNKDMFMHKLETRAWGEKTTIAGVEVDVLG